MLRPGNRAVHLKIVELGILLLDDLGGCGVELNRGDNGGGVPRLEQGLGHEQLACRTGMDPVTNQVLRTGRIDFGGLLERRHDRGIQVGDRGTFLFGQILDELTIANENLIIAPLEIRLAGHVVVRGRLDQCDADAWQVALE